jgi:hypothetical protein
MLTNISMSFDSAISLTELNALRFSDQESKENFFAILSSSEFDRVWVGEEGPLPLPSRVLNWDDFEGYHLNSEKTLNVALRDWLLE